MMTKRIPVSRAVRIIAISAASALVAYSITILLTRNFWLSIAALFVAGIVSGVVLFATAPAARGRG